MLSYFYDISFSFNGGLFPVKDLIVDSVIDESITLIFDSLWISSWILLSWRYCMQLLQMMSSRSAVYYSQRIHLCLSSSYILILKTCFFFRNRTLNLNELRILIYSILSSCFPIILHSETPKNWLKSCNVITSIKRFSGQFISSITKWTPSFFWSLFLRRVKHSFICSCTFKRICINTE